MQLAFLCDDRLIEVRKHAVVIVCVPKTTKCVWGEQQLYLIVTQNGKHQWFQTHLFGHQWKTKQATALLFNSRAC